MSDDRLDQLDYYTLLGLAEGASHDQVREAFHGFALKYHPDRHADAEPQKRERAAQIYRRGAEGYRVLCDPQQRRLYDAGLAKGKLRFDPNTRESQPTPAGGAAQVIGPKAKPFVQKAEQALARGDLKDARLNLQIACGHEPSHVGLQAKLAGVVAQLGKK